MPLISPLMPVPRQLFLGQASKAIPTKKLSSHLT